MSLNLKMTATTPEVKLDLDKGLLELKGVSNPENGPDFYEPIISALNTPDFKTKSLVVEMSLVHFNTSSSKCLYDMFSRLKTVSNEGVELTINWNYDSNDEDMLESGQDFSELLDMHFNYKEY
ncbi:MAG: DUF1987 domain-containing protein [Cyclobacteriaceae bacterium]|nr:DUF1987 domain-containing protein [Cyclobacteriaceae bacterium]